MMDRNMCVGGYGRKDRKHATGSNVRGAMNEGQWEGGRARGMRREAVGRKRKQKSTEGTVGDEMEGKKERDGKFEEAAMGGRGVGHGRGWASNG